MSKGKFPSAILLDVRDVLEISKILRRLFPILLWSVFLIFNNNIYIIHKITLPALMLPDINIETVPLVALYPEQ